MYREALTANIAFVKARQKELGCVEVKNLAPVQVLGGQALKSVPSQMLFRCKQPFTTHLII
jgi:hypothetical protein